MESLSKSIVPELSSPLVKDISDKPPVTGPWLLETGYWDNTGVWDNAAIWINEA